VTGSLWDRELLRTPFGLPSRLSSPVQQPDPPIEPVQPPHLVQVDMLSPEPSVAPVPGPSTLTQAAQMHDGSPPQVDNCPEGSAVKLHDGLYHIVFPDGSSVLIPEAASGWNLGWSARLKRVYYHKPGMDPNWRNPLKFTPPRPRGVLRPNGL